jgi:hypothetical protein
MANAAASKSDGFELLDSPYGRQELNSGPEPEKDED